MLQTVFGQPSYALRSDAVEAFMTRTGGHLGPVTFRLGNRNIQPFSIAPWAQESWKEQPGIIRSLRGDFFCMPFGANSTPYKGENHPLHGETANEDWKLESVADRHLSLSLETKIRAGHVVKELWLKPGHTAIYCRHTVSGMAGPMSLGHHAMLKFFSEGLISLSPFAFGQVFPGQFEDPVQGGYSSLKPGSQFNSLAAVERADGGTANLSRYPAREGYEDLVMVYSSPGLELAWSAAVFPDEGYVWFALRDPRILTGTILWHSNGGRHYAPWSGRHRAVLGIEDVTASMHYGLAGSVAQSDASRKGYKTFVELSPTQPTVVNYIMGVAEVSATFGHVKDIVPDDQGIVISSETGESRHVQLDVRGHLSI